MSTERDRIELAYLVKVYRARLACDCDVESVWMKNHVCEEFGEENFSKEYDKQRERQEAYTVLPNNEGAVR